MRNYLKFWFKYFAFISFFGMCSHLIYLIVPIYMMVIYDQVLYSFNAASLITLSVITLFSLLIMGLLDYFRSRILLQTGMDMENKMRPRVLASMYNQSVAIDSGRYTRGLDDLRCFSDAVKRFKILKILDLPWLIIYVAVLYLMHPFIGIAAIAGLFMVVLFQLLLRQLNKNRYASSGTAAAAGNSLLAATFRNADLIAGMGMWGHVEEKFRRTDLKIHADRYAAESNRCIIGAVKTTLQALFIAGVFGIGTYLFFLNEITVGMIFAGVILTMRLFTPLDFSFESIKSSLDAVAAFKRLSHFVDMRVPDPPLSLPRPEGRLQAEGISLSLRKRALIRNISFQLEPGETLGIFGAVGAGKTAVIRMILGVWSPSSGKMRLDGADIGQWQREKLGTHMGYLPQETELFPGTVAENISRLQPVDADKVIHAAKKAFCHDMISKLPQGYDFFVDDTGRNLSCGQRQQISLARALYDDPQMVVLDEPHLNLDDTGVKSLAKTLQVLKKEKKSVVLVTDRPNFLVTTDKLLMLNEGQTAMFGPTGEVLATLKERQQSAGQPPRQPGGRHSQQPAGQPRNQAPVNIARKQIRRNESGEM